MRLKHALLLPFFIFFILSRPAWANENMLLAEIYSPNTDVSQYLISEKLDGIRAFWDGSQLKSRSGYVIHAPPWFTDPLPKESLDGELWLGRGQFSKLSSLISRSDISDDNWKTVRFMLFERPEAKGSFEIRWQGLRELIQKINMPWLQAIEQFRLGSDAELQERFRAIVKAGGEGLMLHRADAPYTTGRSTVLLKLVPWQSAEATVIAHLPGKGKYLGMTGALRVKAGDGKTFSLGAGLRDTDRKNPPLIGSLITYRYRELTQQGLPRFPVYLHERPIFDMR